MKEKKDFFTKLKSIRKPIESKLTLTADSESEPA